MQARFDRAHLHPGHRRDLVKRQIFVLEQNQRLSLDGWKLADKQKAKQPLSGSLEAGAVKRVDIKAPVALSNKGGIITLLNDKELKVHGVSYTKAQANNPGWTVVF